MNNLIKDGYESFAKEPVGEEKGEKREKLEIIIKQGILDFLKQSVLIPPLKKGNDIFLFKQVDVLWWSYVESDADSGYYLYLEGDEPEQTEVITVSFIYANNNKDVEERLKNFHSMNSFLLTYDTNKHNKLLHNDEIEIMQIHIKMKDLIDADYNVLDFLGLRKIDSVDFRAE
jgi:hypothetical protein